MRRCTARPICRCPLNIGDSSCFVKVILERGYDIRSHTHSNFLLGCVWTYPGGTLSLFNTKLYFPAWSPYLSSSFLYLQQSVCQ